MKRISETIIFFGSGPVAAESLRLLTKIATVEAVVTKPRAAHHKGDVPVLSLAEELAIPTYTVSNRAELEKLFSSCDFESRLGILIDFGIIVSDQVINFFPLGIINSHFSILPEWRGPDPITYSILSGQKQTGVSLMLLVRGMDEGPLLGYGEYDLPSDITTPELTDDLIKLSDTLLGSMVEGYCQGDIEPLPQTITGRKVSYSHKLSKDDGIINWTESATNIERKIRAFFEWPKCHATLGGIDVIVTEAHVVDMKGKPGSLTVSEVNLPTVYCGTHALVIDKVKPAGKKEMTGQAFLAGYKNKLSLE